MFNVIGDSHSNSYSACKNTRVFVIDSGLSIQNLKTYYKPILKAIDSKKDEPWLFVVGELDCRHTIFVESIEKKMTVDDVLEEYVVRLTKFLHTMNSIYKLYGCTVSPTGDFVDTTSEYRAPREIRQVVTAKYNARLQITCKEKGIPFLEVWKFGAHPKDMLSMKYFEDGCHIKTKIASERLDKALELR